MNSGTGSARNLETNIFGNDLRGSFAIGTEIAYSGSERTGIFGTGGDYCGQSNGVENATLAQSGAERGPISGFFCFFHDISVNFFDCGA